MGSNQGAAAGRSGRRWRHQLFFAEADHLILSVTGRRSCIASAPKARPGPLPDLLHASKTPQLYQAYPLFCVIRGYSLPFLDERRLPSYYFLVVKASQVAIAPSTNPVNNTFFLHTAPNTRPQSPPCLNQRHQSQSRNLPRATPPRCTSLR